MRTALKLPLVLLVLVALATGFTSHAEAGTAQPATRAGDRAAVDVLPFKGTFEGRHLSRTPVVPPVFFDRFAFGVGDWNLEYLARPAGAGERSGRVFHPNMNIFTNKVKRTVSQHRSWQQLCLEQNLEAVANTQHQSAVSGKLLDHAHHRRKSCDRTCAQIISI